LKCLKFTLLNALSDLTGVKESLSAVVANGYYGEVGPLHPFKIGRSP